MMASCFCTGLLLTPGSVVCTLYVAWNATFSVLCLHLQTAICRQPMGVADLTKNKEADEFCPACIAGGQSWCRF